MSDQRTAYGIGLATEHTATGQLLDVWYPAPGARASRPTEPPRRPARRSRASDADRGTHGRTSSAGRSTWTPRPPTPPTSTCACTCSPTGWSRPHGLNLDGVFGLLANVVWTNHGPCAVDGFEATRARLRRRGSVTVYGVDKFPRMIDYVVPTGVRIADADRVRLGAHLAAGTTVMHEGFVNFNAGTLGTSMVEGRISAGVVVGDGSDIGGGASIMGTLSGGGSEVVSVGERCLLGANAGHRHLARRRLRGRGRAATSPPAPRSPSPTATWSRPASCPAAPACCSAATR